MIQLDSVSKRYADKRLFRDVSWQITPGSTIGLVGPNGVGKSTMFRIIAGEEPPDDGRVVIPKDVRVGYLPQEVTEEYDGTVLDVVLEGAEELLELENRLEALEDQLQDAGEDSQQLTEEYGELQETFRQRGGYAIRSRAREIVSGLGFENEDYSRPIQEFSGGWRMRALVGRLLLSSPDVLLLDEPTNHLDLESLEWLEAYLKKYDGTIVLISHDRYFLNRLVDQIAELSNSNVKTFVGDYDTYERKRREWIEELERKKKEIEKERAHIQEFIDRFRYKASKAAQVQSRIKMLERMDTIEIPADPTPDINFEFPQPPRIGKTVASLKDVAKAYDDNVVFDGVDFTLHRGDRVAFVGPNGSGKSTLLKMLAGELEPDSGRINLGHRVAVSYFAQHSVDQLDLDHSVMNEMEEESSVEAFPRVRPVLGAFSFSGDDVDKQIGVLSGGEKSRLALAKMLLEPAGLLLLDEPTNHLDIASRKMLEQALRDFDGAFCVVSHDRHFLNAVVNRVIHVEDGALTEYRGDYEYYRWKHGQLVDESDVPDPSGDDEGGGRSLTKKEIRRQSAQIRKEERAATRDLRKELDKIERAIEDAEERHTELETMLADPSTYDDSQALEELNKEYGEVEKTLESLMMKWEEKGAELEEVASEFREREEALRD
ncbi:MAG: ABC-F family ATP-binding cassette domain-containing protein [Myxococcota bacterium]